MAEEGDPPVIIEGNGIKVTDSDGREWIDVSTGYSSIHVGYGRKEIAYAAYEQLKQITSVSYTHLTLPTNREV